MNRTGEHTFSFVSFSISAMQEGSMKAEMRAFSAESPELRDLCRATSVKLEGSLWVSYSN